MRYIALLRGINLGPTNRLKMSELVAVMEKAGFEHVKTYLQSGNVGFEALATPGLDNQIHDLIEAEFGLDVPVIIREQSQILAAVAAQPFSGDSEKCYLTFLAKQPSADDIDPDIQYRDADQWQLIGRDVYLEIPGDYSDSRLTNAYFERNLHVPATTRNWKTVLSLAKL